MMLDRAHELLQQRMMVQVGLRQLEGGEGLAAQVRLPVYRDWIGAGLSATRTVIAVGLGGWFCVASGWPGTTLLLVQLSAFTALLGMQSNPTAAAVNIAMGLPGAALAAGVIGFLLLPQASGFVPFALALTPFAFAFALAAQHPATARFGPGLLLYLTLLLSPANTESFDFAAFLNTVMIQVVALLFMILAFRLILPVSPSRRLFRAADSIGQSLRRALAGRPDRHDRIAARSLRADRLAPGSGLAGARHPVAPGRSDAPIGVFRAGVGVAPGRGRATRAGSAGPAAGAPNHGSRGAGCPCAGVSAQWGCTLGAARGRGAA